MPDDPKIVEQRGGHIWIEPGEGPGATVKFTLPTAGGEAESGDRARQVAGSSSAVRGSSPR